MSDNILDSLNIWSSFEKENITNAGRKKTVLSDSLEGINKLRTYIIDEFFSGRFKSKNNFDNFKIINKEINNNKSKYKNSKIDPEDIPYDLDKQWRWNTLGEICTKIVDGSHNPPPKKKTGYPMISGQNINNNSIDLSNPSRYVNKIEFDNESKRTNIQVNDVLLTIVGSIGRCAIVEDLKTKFVLQRSVAVLTTFLNSQFLSYYLRSSFAQNFLKKYAKGTAQKGIYLKKLATLPIPITTNDIQYDLVDKLNKLFLLLDKTENELIKKKTSHNYLIENLFDKINLDIQSGNISDNLDIFFSYYENLFENHHDIEKVKKLIIELSITGYINNKKKSIFVKNSKLAIKKGWSLKTIKEIGKVYTGNSINKEEKKSKFTNKNGVPYLATKDIGYGWDIPNYDNGISIPENLTNFRYVKPNTPLICAEGGSAGKKCAITLQKVCIGNKLIAIDLYEEIDSEFLLLNYLSNYFITQFQNLMTGIIKGISLKSFNNILIPIPNTLEEQIEIVKEFKIINKTIDDVKINVSQKKNLENEIIQSF